MRPPSSSFGNIICLILVTSLIQKVLTERSETTMTWTLLHEDCEHQEANAVVQRCQSHPEETDSVDEHGLTPLHLLCISNPSIKALSTLLKTNINVLLTKDQHGGEMIQSLFWYRVLLHHQNQPSRSLDMHNTDLPIHIALRNNLVNLDAIAMMIQSCPSSLSISNKEGLMPLHICCRHSPQRLDLIEMIAKRNPKSCHAHTKVSKNDSIRTQMRPLRS